MRLIDADALIDNAREMVFEDINATDHGYSWDAVTVTDIMNAPTIEAVPAVHGEWIGNTCNACGMNWDENMVNNADDWGYFEPMPDFCPNCGAKMRTK